eukprot:scaffold387914_cov30-Prasinocladus_malaysianus.AAC.1
MSARSAACRAAASHPARNSCRVPELGPRIKAIRQPVDAATDTRQAEGSRSAAAGQDAMAAGSRQAGASERGSTRSSWAAELIDRNPFIRDSLAGPMMMTVNAYWLSQVTNAT